MSLGLTTSDWENLRYDYYSTRSSSSYTSSSTSSDESIYVSEKGNTCTDGKDDGKIGLGGVLLNIGEGAVKSVVNGIKGCFTDSEGNFSITKTLTTVAMGAACVAFPAVGLVACGVGAVSGAVKLGTGVVNAMSAETDAEAKDAWEQVGEGGLTLATSALGAKASLNAVKASSTAGLSSLDDAAAAVAQAEGKTSALSQLDDGASLASKAGALLKDMGSSTKNNFSALKSTATTVKDGAELAKLRKEVSSQTGAKTDAELSASNDLKYKELFSSDETLAVADKIESISNTVSNTVKHPISTLKTVGSTAKTTSLSTVKSVFSNMKNLKDTTSYKSILSTLSTKAQTIASELTSGETTYAQAVSEYGWSNVLEVIEAFAGLEMTNEAI